MCFHRLFCLRHVHPSCLCSKHRFFFLFRRTTAGSLTVDHLSLDRLLRSRTFSIPWITYSAAVYRRIALARYSCTSRSPDQIVFMASLAWLDSCWVANHFGNWHLSMSSCPFCKLPWREGTDVSCLYPLKVRHAGDPWVCVHNTFCVHGLSSECVVGEGGCT